MIYLILILIYFTILSTNVLILKHNSYVRNNLDRADIDVLTMLVFSLFPVFQLLAFVGIMSYLLKDYIYTPKNTFKK